MENEKKWEILYDLVMGKNYGVLITHNEISHCLDVPYESPKYYATIAHAKKVLLTQGRIIESVRGVGYRVVEPDDYTLLSVTYFKRGFSRLEKANDLLAYAPTKKMSDEGRLMHRDITDRVRVLAASVAGGCTELKLLVKKQSAFLPENVGRT